MSEDIRKILEAAILAPSGENSQPWRFIVKGNEVILKNDPESDRSLYNSGQRGSFIAHGVELFSCEIIEDILNLGVGVEIACFCNGQI